MDTETQLALSLLGGLWGAGLQMTGSKFAGVVVMAMSLSSVWFALQPRSDAILWGGLAVILTTHALYGLWIGDLLHSHRIRKREHPYLPPSTPLQSPAKQLPQEATPSTPEQLIKAFHSQQQIRTLLRSHSYIKTNALVAYVNIRHRPLAETLILLFHEAGWETELYEPPLDTYLPTPAEGIFIYGCNPRLVSTVVTALKIAGLSEIEARVEKPKSRRNTPKWDWEQQSLRIRIGHHD